VTAHPLFGESVPTENAGGQEDLPVFDSSERDVSLVKDAQLCSFYFLANASPLLFLDAEEMTRIQKESDTDLVPIFPFLASPSVHNLLPGKPPRSTYSLPVF